MAEAIEINLVCNKKLDIEMLLSFINSNAKGNVESRTIEIMDNWEYENRTIVNSEADVSDFIEDKIICITQKYSGDYAGLNIEIVHQKYCYTIWFNIADYDEPNQYSYLIKKFISKYKEIICNNCVLCSVGKEVIFEYEYDCYKTICNSHNIDVWIILSDEYNSAMKRDDNIFSQYSVSTQGDFVLLYKKQCPVLCEIEKEECKYVYQINLKEIIRRKIEYIEKSEVYKDIELENVKAGEIKAYIEMLNDIEMQSEKMFVEKYSKIVSELKEWFEKTEYKAGFNDVEVEQLSAYNNAIVFVMTLIDPMYEFDLASN